jgi:thiosulfate/3-mercaptopyruvate sulfurtransferase
MLIVCQFTPHLRARQRRFLTGGDAMSRWLITAEELAACHRRADVVVFDCRFDLADPGAGEAAYRAGHIPGSHYLHLDRDLSGARGRHGGRHPLPAAAAFADRLSALGVRSDPPTLVVAYDDSRFAFAARLWWLLRYCGHDRVKVLDGGYAAWRAAELPVSAAASAARSGQFTPRLRPAMAVDAAQVRSLRADPGVALIDAREERRYLGLEEPIDPVAGHIDGAVNHPWQQASDARGLLLPPARQRERFGAAADAPGIVMYCGSGVTACVNLLALAELGRDDAQLYAGSWSDWCSYPPAQ